jgi:hypothetical protein
MYLELIVQMDAICVPMIGHPSYPAAMTPWSCPSSLNTVAL